MTDDRNPMSNPPRTDTGIRCAIGIIANARRAIDEVLNTCEADIYRALNGDGVVLAGAAAQTTLSADDRVLLALDAHRSPVLLSELAEGGLVDPLTMYSSGDRLLVAGLIVRCPGGGFQTTPAGTTKAKALLRSKP